MKKIAKKNNYNNFKIRNVEEKDLPFLKEMERKIYGNEDAALIQGEAMIKDIKKANGLKYSMFLIKNLLSKEEKIVGYIVAVEDKTDYGDFCVYLEDIAIVPDFQGKGLGLILMQEFVSRIKKRGILFFDVTLRMNSKKFLDKHEGKLKDSGVELLEEFFLPDYYNKGEDGFYRLYKINPAVC